MKRDLGFGSVGRWDGGIRARVLPLACAAVGLLIGVGCSFDQQGLARSERSTQRVTEEARPIARTSVRGAAAELQDLGAARSQIAAREYWASETEQGLQAPNRAQNLRSRFGPTGVSVHDRTATGSPKLVELRLVALARADERIAVGAGEIHFAEDRVEIRRDAIGLVEWFENREAGLEQGFTLAAPPRLRSDMPQDSAPLVLDLEVEGAAAALQGDEVVLATEAGRKLSYGKLAVADAKGVALAARFEVFSADRVRLIVEDEDAAYPIVIDPLLSNAADSVFDANHANAQLGASVASAGDVNGDGFADLIVGAPLFDFGQVDEGLALVFLGSATGAVSGGALSADSFIQSNQAGAALGGSVASAGDVNGDGFDDVIIGARLFDAGQADEGAAFVFLGSASGVASGDPIAAHAQLEANLAASTLGTSVASAGDVNGDGFDDVIVGAPGHVGAGGAGRAFAFLGSAVGMVDGDPTTAHAEFSPGVFVGTSFGEHVASAGDLDADGFSDVLVSAPSYANGQLDEGAVALFHGSAAGIADGTIATADGRIESDQANAFLTSAASAGDINGDGYGDLIVGVSSYDGGQVDEGAAFVFLGSGAGIVSTSVLTADTRIESNSPGVLLGQSVATAGDVNGDGYSDVVIGMPLFDGSSGSLQTNEGGAAVFIGSSTGLAGSVGGLVTPESAFALIESNLVNAQMGGSVGSGGDVNGDGFSELIVGARFANLGTLNEGAAYVYHGAARAGGLRTVGIAANTRLPALATIGSTQEDIGLGLTVDGAGDINGDGFGDIVLGAAFYDGGEIDEGAVFLFLGSSDLATGIDLSQADTILEGNNAAARFGQSASSAGDVNGDGYADVIVGAPNYVGDDGDEGAAFVFLGSASGIPSGGASTAHARLESNQAGALMGSATDSAGDVNGDGFGDVIVSAAAYDGPEENEGEAYVFLGSSAGILGRDPQTAHAVIETDQPVSIPPNSLPPFFFAGGAGDVDRDGYGDVMIGRGSDLYVFHGSSTGVAGGSVATADTTIDVPIFSMASAGDVNGDGFSDIVVGSLAAESLNPSIIRVAGLVFHGSASGTPSGGSEVASGRLTGIEFNPMFPSSLDYISTFAAAGDTNGDGYGDIVASYRSSGTTMLFLGSSLGMLERSFDAPDEFLFANGIFQGFGGAASPFNVAPAGDVNGDGFADVLHGGLIGSILGVDEAVRLHAGNSRGRPVVLRQLRGDGSGQVVAPRGRSLDPDSFEVSMHVHHPEGRGRVRLQVEACPIGVLFGQPACALASSPAWTPLAIGAIDPVLTVGMSGLAPNGFYRWRARVQRAGLSGPIPLNPTHGPWRRLHAQVETADIRLLPEPALEVALMLGAAALAGVRGRGMGRSKGSIRR